jgi:hypothetical protein
MYRINFSDQKRDCTLDFSLLRILDLDMPKLKKMPKKSLPVFLVAVILNKAIVMS